MLKLTILFLTFHGLLADHLAQVTEEKITKLEPEHVVHVEEAKLPVEPVKVEEHHKFPFNFGFFKSQGPRVKELREGSITLTPVPGRFAVFVTDSGHLVRLMEADPRPPVVPMPDRKTPLARNHLTGPLPVEDSLVTGLTPKPLSTVDLENMKRDGRTFWPFNYFYDPYYYNYGYGGGPGYGYEPYGYGGGYWRSNMRHA